MLNNEVSPSKATNSNKAMLFLGAFIFLALIANLFISSIPESSSDDEFQANFNKNYKVFALSLPESLEFAGEKIPLHRFDVRESIDRELLVNTYWQSNGILFFKRTAKWFPIIEPILKKNNIPDDFKYLALIESGLTNIVSPAGATGYWQFMKAAGQEYGLEINKEIDERYHVEKSTEAACKYLKDAYEKYNSWILAAGSYNMGMNGMNKQLERQKASSYFDLLLNEETARYVYRIIAAKEILTHPRKYGFHIRHKDLYQQVETDTFGLDTPVTNFADFAIERDINYKILKTLNPWLRQNYITNKDSKHYIIKLPKKGWDKLKFPENPELLIGYSADTLK